jgi:hypothetical protein
MKKGNSVNYLFNQLALPEYGENPEWVKDVYEKAREIHKYEIINANMGDDNSPESRSRAEEYYNQKFSKYESTNKKD